MVLAVVSRGVTPVLTLIFGVTVPLCIIFPVPDASVPVEK
jgi:hypothetical protein